MRISLFVAFLLTAFISSAKDHQKKSTTTEKNQGTQTTGEKSCTDYKQYKDVGMDEMKKIADNQSAKILDVNSLDSYNRSRITGAHHFKTLVSKKTLATVLGADKNVFIVAYCGSKQCTAWQEAARTACEMGYKNIRHFSEGISGWDKAMMKKG